MHTATALGGAHRHGRRWVAGDGSHRQELGLLTPQVTVRARHTYVSGWVAAGVEEQVVVYPPQQQVTCVGACDKVVATLAGIEAGDCGHARRNVAHTGWC